ncbi:MAG: hypothetical protein IID18_04895 [Nitrospinae bacterium]|nr:hypothetical protein [Nitrospinota bacterium]
MNENSQHDIDLKEIVATHICHIEVMAEVLIEKGIMTREEYTSRVNQMKAKRNLGMH